MSERSFRSTPITRSESVTFTDTSSLPPHSRGRKIRLRIVTRNPLPELQFLAPFNYDDSEAFQLLQRFVRCHIQNKGKEKRETWEAIKEEDLMFVMDGFEVPFDDPDILRDGDVVQVRLHPKTGIGSEQEDAGESDFDNKEEEDDDDEKASEAEDKALQHQAQNEEEKQAILEATRLAALFRAGIHTSTSAPDRDQVELPSATPSSREKQDDDLPKMPDLSSAVTSSFSAMPAMSFPIMSRGGGRGGGGAAAAAVAAAAAALAAFEAKRNQMQSSTVERVPVRTAIKGPSTMKKRARSESSSSSSSSSSSESSDSDSSSNSSSSTDDNSTTSSDDSDSSSSSSSSSAPSEHHFVSNRHRSPPSHENLVPPGAGTSRTKRRNAMRREKLRLQREAANLAAFNKAKARNTTAGWVEDRQPQPIAIAHVNQVSSQLSSYKNEGLGLPPGEGSLDLTPAGRGKRKRQTPPSPPSPALQERRTNPTLVSIEEGTAPYGGKVPKGISIKHVDCQRYYEGELEKLEAEAEAGAMYGDQPSTQERGEKGGTRKGKGKRRDHQDEDRTTAVDFLLDYGSPESPFHSHPSSVNEQGGPRKKPRIEQPDSAPSSSTTAVLNTILNPLNPSSPRSTSDSGS